MVRWFSKRSRRAFGAGLSAGLLVAVGVLVGGATWRSSENAALDALRLKAVATHSSDTFAMCTGPIADGMEGVFFLDYLTGDLQCLVPNSRTGKVGGAYKYNIMADLGVEPGATKKPAFLMVTGVASFRTGGGDVRPADSILYVADANTGNWVSYSLPWSRTTAATGQPQGGTLIKIGFGKARDLELRN
ncbi:MAG: hypothetical protein U0939_05530 [Pirellulales bacterium]